MNLASAASRRGDFDIIPNMDMSILEPKTEAEALTITLNVLSGLKNQTSLLRMYYSLLGRKLGVWC